MGKKVGRTGMGGAGKLKEEGQIKNELWRSCRERTGLFSAAGRASARSNYVHSGSYHPISLIANPAPAPPAGVSQHHTPVFTMGGVAPSRSESSGRGLAIVRIVMRYLLC